MKKIVVGGILALMLSTFWALPVFAQGRLFLTDQSGVSLAAGLSSADDVSSDGFRTEGWAQGRDALNVGANFYLRVHSSPNLVIYPGFSVDYVKFDLDGGLSQGADDDEIAYGLDLTFHFDGNVYVTPSYQSLGGDKSMGLLIGFLIRGT